MVVRSSFVIFVTVNKKLRNGKALLFASLTKRIKIRKLPPILVLHLKRFKYVEQMQRYKKLTHRVVFPFELRLENTVHLLLLPHKQTKDAEGSDRIYDLVAIVIHIGSGPNQGHYVSIIKSYDRWLLFDDDNIEVSDSLWYSLPCS